MFFNILRNFKGDNERWRGASLNSYNRIFVKIFIQVELAKIFNKCTSVPQSVLARDRRVLIFESGSLFGLFLFPAAWRETDENEELITGRPAVQSRAYVFYSLFYIPLLITTCTDLYRIVSFDIN